MTDNVANKYHERFKHVLDLLDISYRELANKTKIPEKTFYSMKSAGRTPSFDTLSTIKESFPMINMDYLISGQGKPILGLSEYIDVKSPVKTKVNEPAEVYSGSDNVLQKMLQRFIESNEAQVEQTKAFTRFLQEKVS